MSRDPTLPDDLECLQRLVIAQRALIATSQATLLERDLLIGKLRMELSRLKRMQFGRSSEQLDTQIAQLELTLEELQVSAPELAVPATSDSASPPSERVKPVRRPLPATLPRETVTHAPACACPSCGGELRALGEDVAEVLEFVPAPSCTPTIHRCRYCARDAAPPSKGACGPMCAMIGLRAALSHRRCGLATRRIARPCIPSNTLKTIAARCRPTAMRGSTAYMIEPIIRSSKRPAGRMSGASSSMCTHTTASPLAKEALQRIGELYGIEADIRGKPPDQRQRVRQARAGPAHAAFYGWCLATLKQVSRKSELAGAIHYTLSRWSAFTRYRDDDSIEIDNNAAERSLRAVELGRRTDADRTKNRRLRSCAAVNMPRPDAYCVCVCQHTELPALLGDSRNTPDLPSQCTYHTPLGNHMNTLRSFIKPLRWFIALPLAALVVGCGGDGAPGIGTTHNTTAPTVTTATPADHATGVAINRDITATFSEAMDGTTLTNTTFTLTQGTMAVPGAVTYTGSVATLDPTNDLAANTLFTATITTGAKDAAGNAFAVAKTWSFTTGATAAAGPAPVTLGTAGNFAVLAKSGISTVPTSVVTGDIGVSPITATALTGFALTLDSTGTFSTSTQVVGKAYAADYTSPTPTNLTTAVGNMEAAYADAAGRTTPDFTELGSGNISGLVLVPGLYKWGTGVSISTDVTLNGGPNDVWIFQIAGGITQASGIRVLLAGGALAKNIFWQSAGVVALNTTAHLEGIVLSQTGITLATGATVNGRLLAQTAVTLDASTVTQPAP